MKPLIYQIATKIALKRIAPTSIPLTAMAEVVKRDYCTLNFQDSERDIFYRAIEYMGDSVRCKLFPITDASEDFTVFPIEELTRFRWICVQYYKEIDLYYESPLEIYPAVGSFRSSFETLNLSLKDRTD